MEVRSQDNTYGPCARWSEEEEGASRERNRFCTKTHSLQQKEGRGKKGSGSTILGNNSAKTMFGRLWHTAMRVEGGDKLPSLTDRGRRTSRQDRRNPQ